jgi:hypothetical protein
MTPKKTAEIEARSNVLTFLSFKKTHDCYQKETAINHLQLTIVRPDQFAQKIKTTSHKNSALQETQQQVDVLL